MKVSKYPDDSHSEEEVRGFGGGGKGRRATPLPASPPGSPPNTVGVLSRKNVPRSFIVLAHTVWDLLFVQEGKVMELKDSFTTLLQVMHSLPTESWGL